MEQVEKMLAALSKQAAAQAGWWVLVCLFLLVGCWLVMFLAGQAEVLDDVAGLALSMERVQEAGKACLTDCVRRAANADNSWEPADEPNGTADAALDAATSAAAARAEKELWRKRRLVAVAILIAAWGWFDGGLVGVVCLLAC
jgi:hypothetical protein